MKQCQCSLTVQLTECTQLVTTTVCLVCSEATAWSQGRTPLEEGIERSRGGLGAASCPLQFCADTAVSRQLSNCSH